MPKKVTVQYTVHFGSFLDKNNIIAHPHPKKCSEISLESYSIREILTRETKLFY